jgi:predicted SAM-dependent methyltransferase
MKTMRFQSVEPLGDSPYSSDAIGAIGIRGINCGCGRVLPPGWLNVDLRSADDAAGNVTPADRISRLDESIHYMVHDSTQPFPIADGSFDWAYSEHFIEHVPLMGGVAWLREMHRLLRPGGIVRLSTPDLARYVDSYIGKDPDFIPRQREKLAEIPPYDQRTIPDRPGWWLNHIFYNWDHRYIYDFDELRHAATRAGFDADAVRQVDYRQGSVPEMVALDREAHDGVSVYVEIEKNSGFGLGAKTGSSEGTGEG